jgi:hypothetical protein
VCLSLGEMSLSGSASIFSAIVTVVVSVEVTWPSLSPEDSPVTGKVAFSQCSPIVD